MPPDPITGLRNRVIVALRLFTPPPDSRFKPMLKTIAIALLILLVTVFFGVSTVLIHPNLLRGTISASADRFAGLQLGIGDISTHMNPLRMEVETLSLHNPDWGDEALLNIAHLSLALTQLPFSDKPFWDLRGRGIELVVARDEAGKLNWISDKLASGGAQAPVDPAPEDVDGITLPADFNFNDIELENVTVTWRNGDLEERVTLPLIDAQRVEVGNGELILNVRYKEQDFTINSKVDLFEPQNGILNYQLNLDHADASLKTQGRLVLASDLKGSEIDLDLSISQLQNLAALAETTLPELPKTHLKATLAFTPDYEIRDLNLRSGDSQVKGKVEVSQKDFAVTADLTSPLLDIDQLFPAEKATAEESGPEGEINWAWLDSTRVKLRADIASLKARGWQGTDMKLEAQINSAMSLSLQAKSLAEQASNRRYEDLRISAKASPLGETTQGPDINADLDIAIGEVQLNGQGEVNVNGLEGTELQLQATAPNSQTIWTLAEVPWKEAGPLRLKGSVITGSNQHSAKGSAQLGQQDATFDLTYLDQQRPSIKGDLSLSKLDLAFITDAEQTAPSSPPPEEKPTKKKAPVFSNNPLPIDALQSLDIDLNIQLRDIDTGYNLLRSAQLDPTLKDGKFSLKSTTLQFDHGTVKLSASLDSTGNAPSLKTKLQVDGKDYGKLGLEKAAGIRGGDGKIKLSASSQGRSPAELAANLKAKLDAKITDLEAKGNALNLIGSDLLSELISKLNPFAEKRETTDIECVAVHFNGQNGKLLSNNGIALETSSTKIVGTGQVDLADESLTFGVSPIARTGVGINIGAAAGLVRLAGPLQQPRIVADPSGMFTSGLSTGAAIYTGGLSLLAQGLYKRAMYAGSSCDGALDEVPETEALPPELLHPTPEAAPTSPGAVTPGTAAASTGNQTVNAETVTAN